MGRYLSSYTGAEIDKSVADSLAVETKTSSMSQPVGKDAQGKLWTATGKSAYASAQDGGYTGTEAEFNSAMSEFPHHNARHLPSGADPITVKTGNVENAAITAEKLAANAVSSIYHATIDTDYWVQLSSNFYAKEIVVSGLLASDNPIIDFALDITEQPDVTSAQLNAWNTIQFAFVPSDGLLDVIAPAIPDVNIPIKILCIRK